MKLFDVCNLTIQLTTLEGMHSMQSHRQAAGRLGVSSKERDLFSSVLKKLEVFCQDSGFDEQAHYIALDLQRINGTAYTVDVSTLESISYSVIARLTTALVQRRFILIDHDHMPLIDTNEPFGLKVHQAFPSAREDIKEASICLAVGCNTATVYHLMRVAEIGLRALAYDRRVKTPSGYIELATWEEIIKHLEKAEGAIQGYAKTPAREAQFEFVHGALMQFRAFKNVFRNRVSHARESFVSDKASETYENVKAFMKTLSTRICEGQRTPMIWRGKNWTVAG